MRFATHGSEHEQGCSSIAIESVIMSTSHDRIHDQIKVAIA